MALETGGKLSSDEIRLASSRRSTSWLTAALKVHGRGIRFRVALRPGKRCALPDTPDRRVVDLIETAKAHIRVKVEHPFRVIKRQFGFQKTRLHGIPKNSCKINVLAVLSNLFMVSHELLSR